MTSYRTDKPNFLEFWAKWPKYLEGQGQLPPFSIPAESIPGCMFGANLVIPAQICDELSRGQAKLPRILSQNGQNDLEGQGQWPLFSIPTENSPRCMFGANFVIPAQICDELSCGQGKVYGRTDGRMDRRRQWQYPFGLKGQGVKMKTHVPHVRANNKFICKTEWVLRNMVQNAECNTVYKSAKIWMKIISNNDDNNNDEDDMKTIWSIFKIFQDLWSSSVCIRGWTLQIAWIIVLWNPCKWIDAIVPQIWIQYTLWVNTDALYMINNVSEWNDLPASMIILVPLIIFREIRIMHICSSRCGFWSITIPKNFAQSTSTILDPSIYEW